MYDWRKTYHYARSKADPRDHYILGSAPLLTRRRAYAVTRMKAYYPFATQVLIHKGANLLHHSR